MLENQIGQIILKIAVPSPLEYLLDYLPPDGSSGEGLVVGMRVSVSFGRRQVVGVIFAIANSTHFDLAKLKKITAVLDEEPLLSAKFLELMYWVSDYYHHSLGEVVSSVLPKLLRDTKRKKDENFTLTAPGKINESHLRLNGDQCHAIDIIKNCLGYFQTFLLDGVTGSGKTEVYLRVIEAAVVAGKQALLLVPEINLTPQMIARFTEHFSTGVVVFHSRLTPRERLASWQLAQRGAAPIIIGTRSAIFTPLKSPGIIVVDEEHDLSFKQQTGLKYSARDLAVARGKLENIPVVLGSATPSLESIHNVKKGRYQLLSLVKRIGAAVQPTFHIVDMRSQKLKNGIALGLLGEINRHINNGGQVLVFLNRRGFAPLLICHHCGWTANCRYCDARLTLHQTKKHLGCHHCGMAMSIPSHCPHCGDEKLLALGIGTERVEEILREHFPTTPLVRIDRDTTRSKNSLENILGDIHDDKYQILIGTQMLAKGHHFPKVTMVAILNVDQSLGNCDFRASEHLAQLIMQVAGRAGRAAMSGEVYLQTHMPDHPLLLSLIRDGYGKFVTNCLVEREHANLPPYAHLALIQAEGKNQGEVDTFLSVVCDRAKKIIHTTTKIFGPVPNYMERKGGYFRLQLLLQNNRRHILQPDLVKILDILRSIGNKSRIKWYLDVDPLELG